MIDCARSIGLLNKDLQKVAHTLRKRRNDIHLHALGTRKTAYSSASAQQSVAYMVDVLKKIDEKLASLS